ncbi:MAG: tRNA (adenosine(37)-N6)-threonylcarbamoyltransferase complex dimerization subunit type 1 TsaB [Pseudomonadota bacterium]
MTGKSTDGMLLALDTSGPACSIALAQIETGDLLESVSRPMERGQAEAIIPMVHGALERGSVSFEDIVTIAVCIGPGSFAGLRAGLSAAKGFALASGAALVGISAFDAHGREASNDDWIVLDGRRGEAFIRPKGSSRPGIRLMLDDAPSFDFETRALHGPFAAELANAAALPLDQVRPTAPLADIHYIAHLALDDDWPTRPATLDYMRGADAKVGAGFSLKPVN